MREHRQRVVTREKDIVPPGLGAQDRPDHGRIRPLVYDDADPGQFDGRVTRFFLSQLDGLWSSVCQ